MCDMNKKYGEEQRQKTGTTETGFSGSMAELNSKMKRGNRDTGEEIIHIICDR
jgi:hypothetical protein